MSFRLNARCLYLTYPQVGDVTTDNLEDVLKAKGAKKYIIGVENHQDGGTHFHVLVDMERTIDWTGASCLDIGTLHGNYQAARKPMDVLVYVTKDGNTIVRGWTDLAAATTELERAGKKRKSDWIDIGQLILSGKSSKEIVLSEPIRFRDLDRIDKAVSQYNIWNMKPKDPFQGVKSESPSLECHQICQWINDNVQKDRAFKAPQLYVFGDRNLGKTALINTLSDVINVYYAPCDGEWMDDYTDDYDLIVFDEFRAQYTIQWLNRFLEGSCFPLKRRAKSPYLKKKNVPVIILSNYSLQEAYARTQGEKLETLRARLTIIHVTQILKIGLMMENPVIQSQRSQNSIDNCGTQSETELPRPNGMQISGEILTLNPGIEDMRQEERATE